MRKVVDAPTSQVALEFVFWEQSWTDKSKVMVEA